MLHIISTICKRAMAPVSSRSLREIISTLIICYHGAGLSEDTAPGLRQSSGPAAPQPSAATEHAAIPHDGSSHAAAAQLWALDEGCDVIMCPAERAESAGADEQPPAQFPGSFSVHTKPGS